MMVGVLVRCACLALGYDWHEGALGGCGIVEGFWLQL